MHTLMAEATAALGTTTQRQSSNSHFPPSPVLPLHYPPQPISTPTTGDMPARSRGMPARQQSLPYQDADRPTARCQSPLLAPQRPQPASCCPRPTACCLLQAAACSRRAAAHGPLAPVCYLRAFASRLLAGGCTPCAGVCVLSAGSCVLAAGARALPQAASNRRPQMAPCCAYTASTQRPQVAAGWAASAGACETSAGGCVPPAAECRAPLVRPSPALTICCTSPPTAHRRMGRLQEDLRHSSSWHPCRRRLSRRQLSALPPPPPRAPSRARVCLRRRTVHSCHRGARRVPVLFAPPLSSGTAPTTATSSLCAFPPSTST